MQAISASKVLVSKAWRTIRPVEACGGGTGTCVFAQPCPPLLVTVCPHYNGVIHEADKAALVACVWEQ